MLHPVEHVLYKLLNAPILRYPFPHFFVDNVFPEDFFRLLRNSLGDDGVYEPLKEGYAARVASSEMPDCMLQFTDEDATHAFMKGILTMFTKYFYERFPAQNRPEFRSEWRFIRDSEGYKIGPHTDAPQKVVSLLFYISADHPGIDLSSGLPVDSEIDTTELFHDYAQYGTGIYIPEDHQKLCRGGPHYPFDGFREVWRAPFFANSCFGFWKTANSWHGVAPIDVKIRRDVLLYNIFQEK